MKIKKVQFRNFSSYGNNIQEIDFTDRDSLFTLIDGKNGAGKSSIMDVIKFAIYGKLSNKNMKDIPNRINQNCWTNIELYSNSKLIRIERGINPGFLKLWIDNVEYDQANKKLVQKYIEDELIELPFMVFDNTLSISIKEFKSFLKMSPSEKRAIIDRIFSLNIFNEMKGILKSELKEINYLTGKYKNDMSNLNKSISTTETEITNLENRLKIFSASEVKRLTEELNKYTELQGFIVEKYNTTKEAERKFNESIVNINKSLSVIRQEIKNLDEKINLYEKQKCPMCESDLHTEFHVHALDNIFSQKESKLVMIQEFLVEEKEVKEALQKCKNELNESLEKNTKCKSKILQLRDKISEHKEVKTEEVSSLNTLKNEFETQASKLNETLNIKEKENRFLNLIDSIIGDDGVKKVIVRNMIPSFNKEINRLLSKIHVNYLINFNEELEPIITEYGHPISPETLSAGEGAKTDFVILIALIKMMKIKFNNINVLFLDEIFSNLDSEAIHEVIVILRGICTDLKLNIFVVHHAPLAIEYFDQKLTVSKKDSFSNFSIEKIS